MKSIPDGSKLDIAIGYTPTSVDCGKRLVGARKVKRFTYTWIKPFMVDWEPSLYRQR